MKKMYITFGQNHKHEVNGKVFDCNSVAVIPCDTYEEGRRKSFDLFGEEWCYSYFDEEWKESDIRYYSRGLIDV